MEEHLNLWPRQNNLVSRIEKARAEDARLAIEIAADQAELDAALVAEQPSQAKIEKLEAAITEKRRKSERQRHTVDALEKKVAKQERAQAAARKAEEAARVETLVKQWGEKNAAALEKAIGEVAALFQRQVELGIEIDSAWSWSNGERMGIKLSPADLKTLVAIEMFRACASRLPVAQCNNDQYILPGGMCPIGDRLQPHKIPFISETLRGRAQFAVNTLRAAVGAKQEKAA